MRPNRRIIQRPGDTRDRGVEKNGWESKLVRARRFAMNMRLELRKDGNSLVNEAFEVSDAESFAKACGEL
jgi:hypothetical protein